MQDPRILKETVRNKGKSIVLYDGLLDELDAVEGDQFLWMNLKLFQDRQIILTLGFSKTLQNKGAGV